MKAQYEIMPCDFQYYVTASNWEQDKQQPQENYFQVGGVRGTQLVSSDSRCGRKFPFQLFDKAFMIAIEALSLI
jgi:hypothetical protein